MSACPTNDELEAFLQNALTPENSLRITKHLAVCENCRSTVDQRLHDGEADCWRTIWRELKTEDPALAADEAPQPVAGGTAKTPATADDSAAVADEPSLEDAQRLLEGVPGVRVLRVLGRGSYGIVVLAQGELHPQLAVKVLRPRWAEDPNEVDRFLREARRRPSTMRM